MDDEAVSAKQLEDRSQNYSIGVSVDNKKLRAKEATIADIIQKVALWRWIYNENYEYSFQDAAAKVGVAKKSLDDYLLQINRGKKLKFDFIKHQHDKVGVLRKWCKHNCGNKE